MSLADTRAGPILRPTVRSFEQSVRQTRQCGYGIEFARAVFCLTNVELAVWVMENINPKIKLAPQSGQSSQLLDVEDTRSARLALKRRDHQPPTDFKNVRGNAPGFRVRCRLPICYRPFALSIAHSHLVARARRRAERNIKPAGVNRPFVRICVVDSNALSIDCPAPR